MNLITSEDEFKKNSKLQKTDVDIFRNWVERQPHFPKIKDELLILFLHCTENSIEKSKIYLDNYLTIRTNAPEIFRNRNPFDEAIQNVMGLGQIAVLPERDKRGYVVIVGRIVNSDASLFVYKDYLRFETMVQDLCQKIYGTVPGVLLIGDLSMLTMAHIVKCNPWLIKKYITYTQDAIPTIIRDFHFVNVGQAFHTLINMAKPFMNKQHLNKIHFYSSNIEDLYHHVPKKILPKELGGDLESIEYYYDGVKEMLNKYSYLFKDDDALIVDESKRPEKARMISDSMDGSFKQLNID